MKKYPNIKDVDRTHGACMTDTNDATLSQTVWVGDVRKCPHGKIQICYQPRGGARGPSTILWRDISRFWNPKEYRLAKMAIERQFENE